MANVCKYYKNSTIGYLVVHTYSTENPNISAYIKDGKDICDVSILKGCVPIKKEKFQRELKYIKNKKQNDETI